MPRKTIAATDKAKSNAKKLRRAMTKEEKHLWYDFLSSLPANFVRQKAIGYYIADFYCPKLKLVVEIDGSQHFDDENLRYDEQRTQYFSSEGIRVLRFTNRDINLRFRDVCETIYSFI